MKPNEPLSPDDPRYQARLQAQHRVVLAIGVLPLGILIGLLVAVPLAQMTKGFPFAIIPTGISMVLVFLGIGLYVLALMQGFLLIVEGFWNLRHSFNEISSTEKLIWRIALTGVSVLGLGVGFGLCFLVV